jgi:hypothetical protein
MDPSFAVRRMKADEVDLIREWAAAEGWNPGRYDGPCFFATDPDGFFVGELGRRPVACLSCVAYDDGFGFLGQYIVAPDCRGRGYGLRTWQAGLAHLGGRNVGLDGVLAQQGNYERSGFRFANHHIRYTGQGGGAVPPGLVRLSAVPVDELVAYDRTCFPAPRPGFIRAWVTLPESVALGCVRDGRLAGYGGLRRSADGYKIGPLFADDDGAADLLLRGLAAEAGSHPFCLDVPEAAAHPSAERLAKSFGMREVFRTARMYTRGVPPIRSDRVYGITTMELG